RQGRRRQGRRRQDVIRRLGLPLIPVLSPHGERARAAKSPFLASGEGWVGAWRHTQQQNVLPIRGLLDARSPLWHGSGPRTKPTGAATAMTKSELVQRLAESNPHLYQRDVEIIVTAIFDEIAAALARGDRVELRGFGAFSVKRREARTGRNPRTGDSVQVAEKHIPFFKTGKQLR